MIMLQYLKIELNTDLKITLLGHQNYYVGHSSIMNSAAKSFDILAISLSILHDHFDDLTKLFSDLYLYLAKFLDTLDTLPKFFRVIEAK